jgi:hypothetical protein
VRSVNTLIVLAMALGAVPALAQTPAPAGPPAAPARVPQTNWWSQAGAENGPERIVWAAQKSPETPYTGVTADLAYRRHSQGASDRRWESRADTRLRRSLRPDGPGRQGCAYTAPTTASSDGSIAALWKMTIDGRAQGLVQELAFNGATPVLPQNCRHRTGCILPQHARRAGASIGKRHRRPFPATSIKTGITSTGG